MSTPDAHAFVGGRILTMDASYPDPEVVVVERGYIAAVGNRGLLQTYPLGWWLLRQDPSARDRGGPSIMAGDLGHAGNNHGPMEGRAGDPRRRRT